MHVVVLNSCLLDIDQRFNIMVLTFKYLFRLYVKSVEQHDQAKLRKFLNQMQLCFLHPSKHKFEHPRFCYERLEYLGQKIQVRPFLTFIREEVLLSLYQNPILDVWIKQLTYGGRSYCVLFKDIVMAERLLMKHLDAPGRWLQVKHRRLLMNKFCGRYLRERYLHKLIIYSEKVQDAYENNRRLRNPAATAVQQALHGLSYVVYGKPDVRRIMFEVFDFEQIQPKAV